jgi:uncharacterized protein YukE
MSFLDVHPDAVVSAGNRTAGTSDGWQSWAHTTETTLRDAATVVQDGAVGGAVATYLSNLNPAMQSIAQQVDALGTNTTSAANVVTNADGEATIALTQTGQRSMLSRPITV